MLFGHHRLKIGGRLLLRFALTGSPFHKEAVAQASEHSHNPNPIGAANPAAILVVRDVQPLMGAGFNAPGRSIELEPPQSRQLPGLHTAHQRHQFVFTACDLAQEQGALLGKRKTDLFGRQRRRAEGPALRPALVDFLGAGLSRRGLQRGKNRPGGP